MARRAAGCCVPSSCFSIASSPPTEAEQSAEYQRIAAVLGERPLTIRTLDAGGDKPIAYLPLPAENNPALGLRGVRTSLAYPQLLRTQLRAVLAVRSPQLPAAAADDHRRR